MALPKAIQAQAEAADALVAQMNGEPANTDTPPQNNEPSPADPPPDNPPQNVSPEPQPQPVVPEETWQAKFFTLKGKYDAEVPRLHVVVLRVARAPGQLRPQPRAHRETVVRAERLPPARQTADVHAPEAIVLDALER